MTRPRVTAWLLSRLFGVQYVWTKDFNGSERLRRVFDRYGIPTVSAIAKWHKLPLVASGTIGPHQGCATAQSCYVRGWRPAFETKADKVMRALTGEYQLK